jgi:hypothetical protein
MGMRMTKTCWAVFKWQVINLRNFCIWLVDSVEIMMMHELPNPKSLTLFVCLKYTAHSCKALINSHQAIQCLKTEVRPLICELQILRVDKTHFFSTLNYEEIYVGTRGNGGRAHAFLTSTLKASGQLYLHPWLFCSFFPRGKNRKIKLIKWLNRLLLKQK